MVQIRAFNLLICMLENLKEDQSLDNYLEPILQVTVDQMQLANVEITKFTHIQAFAMCFFYDTPKTLSVLESRGWTGDIFSHWFSKILDAKYDFEVKRMIIGIANIVACQESPSMISDNLTDILENVAELCKKSIVLKDTKGGAVDKDEERNPDFVVEDLDGNSIEDDSGDESFEIGEDDEVNEGNYYISPITGMNEVNYFRQALESIGNEKMTSLIQALPDQARNDLKTAFDYCKE